jgi:transcriptional regulator with XRE-family HTH domain
MSEGPVAPDAERGYGVVLREWRERRRLSQKAFAEQVAYDRTYVSHIENGNQEPTEDFTRQAEGVLQTGGRLWALWEAHRVARSTGNPRPAIPQRDLRTVDFVAWLAEHSDAGFEECYEAVSVHSVLLDNEPPAARYAREHARRQITRDQLAQALTDYYGRTTPAGAFYRGRVEGVDASVSLSIFGQPDWFDAAPDPPDLGGPQERFRFVTSPPTASGLRLDEAGWRAAVERLASVETTDTVMVNNPLYRLLDVTIEHEQVGGSFGLTDFATYALTGDLLESELLGALAAGGSRPDLDQLGLRNAYLPSTDAALDLGSRVCVGGPVALLAVARSGPESPDYLLLVQERSSAVLNVTGRLAVIPKAFHQPTGDPRAEVALSATVRRELEEELLGRQDLEQVSSAVDRHVDPLHSERVSPPMTWLIERQGTDAFWIECTGFGFNMVTGNYEFPCLIVINDPSWWDTFGHHVETNWEAMRIHRYSSLDTDGLANLIADPRWSNEGLFALLQGLRRLANLDPSGWIAAPTIALEE